MATSAGIDIGNADAAYIYGLIHDGLGRIWNENASPEPGFVPMADAVRGDCALYAAPSGLSQIWRITVPATLPAGTYSWSLWTLAYGADPADDDTLLTPPVGTQYVYDGTKEVSLAEIYDLLLTQGTGDGVSSPSPGAV